MRESPEVHVVDNRVLLLGLDKLYRDAMQYHESDELLSCAREVAHALRVAPATGPVEGYYSESALLTEYFQLMRALQAVPNKSAARFWDACDLEAIVGRCVRIGYDDTVNPVNQYHWAIGRTGPELEVEEFWAPEIWTTERYRRERLHIGSHRGRLMGLDGMRELEL